MKKIEDDILSVFREMEIDTPEKRNQIMLKCYPPSIDKNNQLQVIFRLSQNTKTEKQGH